MKRRLIWAVCLGWLALGCGKEEQRTARPPLPVVPYVSVGYVAEQRAVRVAWLPVRDPYLEGYVVYRTGPYALGTPVSEITPEPTALTAVSAEALTYDDRTATTGFLYGYAVAVSGDGREGELSDWAWLPIESFLDPVPIEAATYDEPCGLEGASFLRLVPEDPARPDPRTRPPAVRVEATTTVASVVRVAWEELPLAGGIRALGEVTAALDPPCEAEPVTMGTTWSGDPAVYAVRAHVLFDGYEANLLFPNEGADEWVRMRNVSPAVGQAIAQGYHTFRADVAYRVANVDARLLTVMVLSVDADGGQRFLGAVPIPLVATEGEVSQSLGVRIPEEARRVIFAARFGEGSPFGAVLEDRVEYAIVP